MNLLRKASIAGFAKIGINNFQKKNFATNAFFSVSLIEGNFLEINIDIILHKHFTE